MVLGIPILANSGQDIGPPKQATGPPRSGAGVGVGMLMGYHNVSWKSHRFEKLDSTIHNQLFKIIDIFSKLF